MIIAFEGIDGCGKSSVIRLLKERKYFESKGLTPVFVREPGGCTVSEHIRELLLSKSSNGMCGITELLLFEASRYQLIHDRVAKEADDKNKIIIYDRYVLSTEVYQGIMQGVDLEFIRVLHNMLLNKWLPDLNILIDTKPEIALERRNSAATNRLDAATVEIAKERRDAYMEVFGGNENCATVNGDGSLEEVYEQVTNLLDKVLD